MGFIDELEPAPRPVRVDGKYYFFIETGYNANNYPGSAGLAAAVRADLAAAKTDGRLPRTLRTLVSVRSDYGHSVLSVRVRGLTEDELFEVAPGPAGIVGTISGVRTGGSAPSTTWRMNKDWAFVLLQVHLIAEGYNVVSQQEGDDYPQDRYTCHLYVDNAGSFGRDHLATIVDAGRP